MDNENNEVTADEVVSENDTNSQGNDADVVDETTEDVAKEATGSVAEEATEEAESTDGDEEGEDEQA